MDKLAILSALAKIRDIQDFRLRDFMSSIGLDERQPSTFYRELLKESRDAIRLIGNLQNQSDASENKMLVLETDRSTQQQQIADLKTKISSLENETRQRIKELEIENHQLREIASGLRKGDQNYEGIKDLMRGKIDRRALRALRDLVSAIYDYALAAALGGKPEVEPEDLELLAPIRARLREELMSALQIPKEELEEKLIKAERRNKALMPLVHPIFGDKGRS